MDRQMLQSLIDLMQQHGVFHGLLAGLTALIRGAYESEGLAKALLDAALCTVIGTFVFAFPGFGDLFKESPQHALIAAIVVGVIGANLIITTLRDCFAAALKQLNPATWFKKAK
ncbi:putative holin [Pectobacterium phage PP101]|nr:holin/anti-holin [Pectobacterium phage PP101]APD19733.1 putative holin [Pectobacterium phage PP101]